MTGNEITEMEKELWKKVFRVNNSLRECNNELNTLKKEYEIEIINMNVPSKEIVNKLALLQKYSIKLTSILLECQIRLIRLNPNFKNN